MEATDNLVSVCTICDPLLRQKEITSKSLSEASKKAKSASERYGAAVRLHRKCKRCEILMGAGHIFGSDDVAAELCELCKTEKSR